VKVWGNLEVILRGGAAMSGRLRVLRTMKGRPKEQLHAIVGDGGRGDMYPGKSRRAEYLRGGRIGVGVFRRGNGGKR